MNYVKLILLITIVCTIVYYIQSFPRQIPIRSIWVINMEKDAERMQNIQSKTKSFQHLVKRWPATVGKDVNIHEAHNQGVSKIIGFKTGDIKDQTPKPKDKIDNNQGIVGVWLSHKRVLTHLSKQNLPDSYAHMITEDDIDFPVDFMDQWAQIAPEIPSNWDIIYVGMKHPLLEKQVGPRIYRGIPSYNDKGNWGTHAYIVRHGALPRILSKLKYMSHEIDVQLNLYFGDFNVYIIQPSIISLNPVLSKISTIEHY